MKNKNVGDQETKKKPDYLRWVISLFFTTYLVIDLIFFRHNLTWLHCVLFIFLFIFGIADRFQFIKIPGFVELKDTTEKINKKTDSILTKIQQLQIVSINVNPQQNVSTFTSSPQKDKDTRVTGPTGPSVTGSTGPTGPEDRGY